ncbi:hypothetical protein T02_16265 [Trichinella nativa]|uniref:Uncharacterized protein n=1 Tax=Trichinella nativa TaxID=6335 RepID=A0A0V1L9B1_9BILA|nr:hypothetical protein T02_16265 [Trichinella nativa]
MYVIFKYCFSVRKNEKYMIKEKKDNNINDKMRCAIWDGVGSRVYVCKAICLHQCRNSSRLYEFTQLSNCVIFDCRTAVGSSSKQQASMSIDNLVSRLSKVEISSVSLVHFIHLYEYMDALVNIIEERCLNWKSIYFKEEIEISRQTDS